MRIDINASKIDLTPSLKKYVNMKMGSLSRFVKRFEKEGELTVFFEVARATKHHKHGDVFYAEANLKLPGKLLRAESYNSDIRVAVDSVKTTLKQEIVKYKNTLISKKKKNRI